jgi:hypothetical protein
MPRNTKGSSSKKIKQLVKSIHQEPNIMPTRIKVSGADIPQYIPAPPVMRVVRYKIVLTSGSPSASITYNQLAIQDAINYTGGSTLRYSFMRVINVKAWAESPNSLGVSQSPYGLVLFDNFTNFSVQDRAITGSKVSAVGFTYPFYVRSVIIPTTSPSVTCNITCDQTIAASTNFAVTVDSLCEFIS